MGKRPPCESSGRLEYVNREPGINQNRISRRLYSIESSRESASAGTEGISTQVRVSGWTAGFVSDMISVSSA